MQNSGISGREKSLSIAEVEIYVLKAHAIMMSDSSMTADVVLQDLTLEDTRSIRKCGVKRFALMSITLSYNCD